MASFARIVRICLRYRLTFVSTIVCAISIGFLWGTNIGTVFPFVEVVFRGQSLPEWVDREVSRAEQRIATLESELAMRADAASQKGIEGTQVDVRRMGQRLQAEKIALNRYRQARPWIHRYLPVRPFPTLVLIVVLLFWGTLIKTVFLAISTILTEKLAQIGTIHLRKRFFNQVLQMPVQRLHRDDSSQLLSRLTYDLEQVTVALRMLFGRTLREPLKMLACLIGAGLVCWRLLMVSLIFAPVAAWLISRLNRSMKRANARALEEMSRIYNVVADSLRGIKLVKAFTIEPMERRRFDQVARRFYRRAMRVAALDALIRPSIEMMTTGVICIAILAGGYLVLNEQTHLLGIRISERPLSISTLLLFFGLLAGVSDPARKLSGVIGRLQRGAAAADRIYQLMDEAPRLPRVTNPRPLGPLSTAIEFKGVHFAYGAENRVLEDVNLTIHAGETVALVGPNGCGKSTLASLLLRFHDPTNGCVTFDGIDLREVRRRDVRRQIGWVAQDAVMFNDTVMANLRIGCPTATDDQVVAAAQQAMAHDFITNRLPNGYQTVVGENACRLSGGQKQRLALARAILRDPRLLLLDEATSQVDIQSEQQINQVLRDFKRGRTTVIITHRLGILELADRIVVMQQGRLMDVGTLDELLVRCDVFRRLAQIEQKHAA